VEFSKGDYCCVGFGEVGGIPPAVSVRRTLGTPTPPHRKSASSRSGRD
jgi:hypothetical protein